MAKKDMESEENRRRMLEETEKQWKDQQEAERKWAERELARREQEDREIREREKEREREEKKSRAAEDVGDDAGEMARRGPAEGTAPSGVSAPETAMRTTSSIPAPSAIITAQEKMERKGYAAIETPTQQKERLQDEKKTRFERMARSEHVGELVIRAPSRSETSKFMDVFGWIGESSNVVEEEEALTEKEAGLYQAVRRSSVSEPVLLAEEEEPGPMPADEAGMVDVVGGRKMRANTVERGEDSSSALGREQDEVDEQRVSRSKVGRCTSCWHKLRTAVIRICCSVSLAAARMLCMHFFRFGWRMIPCPHFC